MAMLRVDDEPEVIGYSSGGYTQLTLPLNLFIGGISNLKHVSKNSGAKHFFSGCMRKVIINGRSLAFQSEALAGVNIGDCSELLCSDHGVCPGSDDQINEVINGEHDPERNNQEELSNDIRNNSFGQSSSTLRASDYQEDEASQGDRKYYEMDNDI